MNCCCSCKTVDKKKLYIMIFVCIVSISLKILALVDLFKKRKSYSKRKKIFVALLIIIFPPAPIIYLAYVYIKSAKEENYQSVNLNREGLL